MAITNTTLSSARNHYTPLQHSILVAFLSLFVITVVLACTRFVYVFVLKRKPHTFPVITGGEFAFP
jgi:hypothetical protein